MDVTQVLAVTLLTGYWNDLILTQLEFYYKKIASILIFVHCSPFTYSTVLLYWRWQSTTKQSFMYSYSYIAMLCIELCISCSRKLRLLPLQHQVVTHPELHLREQAPQLVLVGDGLLPLIGWVLYYKMDIVRFITILSTVFAQNLLVQLTIMSSRWILAYDLHCFLESQGHSGLSQGHSGLDI